MGSENTIAWLIIQKSNFENQDSNMKEEECFIIDEKDLYINRFNGFISYYEEDYYEEDHYADGEDE